MFKKKGFNIFYSISPNGFVTTIRLLNTRLGTHTPQSTGSGYSWRLRPSELAEAAPWLATLKLPDTPDAVRAIEGSKRMKQAPPSPCSTPHRVCTHCLPQGGGGRGGR